MINDSHQGILHSGSKGMTKVQHTGDIGRGQDNCKPDGHHDHDDDNHGDQVDDYFGHHDHDDGGHGDDGDDDDG